MASWLTTSVLWTWMSAGLTVTAALGCRRAQPGPTPEVVQAVWTDGEASAERWSVVSRLASDAFEGRAPGTAGGLKARALIVETMQRCGWEVAEHTTNGPGVNLVATQKGAWDVARRVLLSAHYDHLGVRGGEVMNGADDNAAAVGAIIEVACRFHAPEDAQAGLVVVFWDAEEPPYFMTPQMGSASFVAKPPFPLASIDVAVVLDLVGGGLWRGAPHHFALGGETAAEVAAAVRETPSPEGLAVVEAGLHLVEQIVATGGVQPWSDYAPFRDAGVPVLFLSNGQTHRYHTAKDDFESLDLVKLGRQTDWLLSLVERLVRAPEKPRFVPGIGERPAIDGAAALVVIDAALGAAERGVDGAAHFDKESLRRDRAAVSAAGGGAGALAQRRAIQRIQCFAGGHYPPALCARF